MARAIQRGDFPYEVNDPDTLDAVGFLCLISMDRFNVKNTVGKIKPVASPSGVFPFHTSLYKNKNEIGIHPRHVIGEYSPTAEESVCNVAVPRRTVEIPVLTIAQFNDIELWDDSKDVKEEQPKASLEINHTANGSKGLLYRIIRKVPERSV
jgi:hypothetical protein